MVHYYWGLNIASPALGSAGPLMKKICYGLGLPGLVGSTLLDIHFAAKYIFVRILRNSIHLTSNYLIHWSTWLGCTFSCTVIAYLIASGIPVFSGQVSCWSTARNAPILPAYGVYVVVR
ncbi:hypothetical protein ASPVEDRAFT_264274 [Aspergillus versicolor CBS 583.65]|uniref:Uncharacterized protein n=1 Tax=Aspergillus versicolor CBS 583.65 TaxID=1036611 RepID=A0A1L9P6D9_ASPVE|nr:uncharacterized protein ASPVEDRAFT_264274 [Aspergillus versicolor CBS 583.65]OJI96993.1 hypothetical protein ASPVEDRAFT_264274 [Aspergillus versicolor CBS 583.65]